MYIRVLWKRRLSSMWKQYINSSRRELSCASESFGSLKSIWETSAVGKADPAKRRRPLATRYCMAYGKRGNDCQINID